MEEKKMLEVFWRGSYTLRTDHGEDNLGERINGKMGMEID